MWIANGIILRITGRNVDCKWSVLTLRTTGRNMDCEWSVITLRTTDRDVDCKWNNSTYHWPRCGLRIKCHNSTHHWPQCGLRMECYNSTHHWPRRKIDPGRLNDYKNFSTLVFLLSSHWVRRFFTDQSVVLPSSKATLPLIDVAPTMARPRWLELRWSRPTMARPPMAWSPKAWLLMVPSPQWSRPTIAWPPMVPTLDGSTSDGLAPQHWTKARPATHQRLYQESQEALA